MPVWWYCCKMFPLSSIFDSSVYAKNIEARFFFHFLVASNTPTYCTNLNAAEHAQSNAMSACARSIKTKRRQTKYIDIHTHWYYIVASECLYVWNVIVLFWANLADRFSIYLHENSNNILYDCKHDSIFNWMKRKKPNKRKSHHKHRNS